ncbi:unnamed protein product, partial [Vitis vinifera]
MGNGKQRWRVFYKSSSSSNASKRQSKEPPKEFLCPISGSLMADPVIVSSGQTFERACVQVCKALGFNPTLSEGSSPDFSTIIPNLAIQSTILSWCDKCSVDRPKPLDFDSAEKVVRTLMASQKAENKSEDSDKELIKAVGETPPVLNCYSSSSSSEIETLNPDSPEEDEGIIAKLKSPQVFEQEEALVSLRKITRTGEETRVSLCSPRLLSMLRSLIISRYSGIQVNAVAVLVNLSLEKINKVKIVRSGIVPPLIDVLKGGFPEAQDHAAGALFSLALEDANKTAIGVLGALPPLLHTLRSESERARNDSALALYHLSLVQSNRTKLVKLGAVQILMGMVNSGHLWSRALLVLCNLAACPDGRTAMLDAGAVECLVGLLRGNELDSDSIRESCLAALYALSFGGSRFKGLAKEAGAMETLMRVEKIGSERAREKAKKILEIMREKTEEGLDWEALLDSGLVSRTRYWPLQDRSSPQTLGQILEIHVIELVGSHYIVEHRQCRILLVIAASFSQPLCESRVVARIGLGTAAVIVDPAAEFFTMREPNRVGTTQRHHFLNREPSHSENRNYLRNGHRGSWKVTFNPVRPGDQPISSPQRDLVEGTSHHGDEIAGSDGENVGTGDHTGASELEGGLGADNDVEAVAGEGEVHVGIALGLPWWGCVWALTQKPSPLTPLVFAQFCVK